MKLEGGKVEVKYEVRNEKVEVRNMKVEVRGNKKIRLEI